MQVDEDWPTVLPVADMAAATSKLVAVDCKCAITYAMWADAKGNEQSETFNVALVVRPWWFWGRVDGIRCATVYSIACQEPRATATRTLNTRPIGHLVCQGGSAHSVKLLCLALPKMILDLQYTLCKPHFRPGRNRGAGAAEPVLNQ